MLKKALYIIAGTLCLSIAFFSCHSSSDEIVAVNNSTPKFVDRKYVELELLFRIDVTQISLFNKDTSGDFQRLVDFDDDNNMYILDSFESKISVFNEQGELVRAFGKAGQGPKEFLRPGRIIINKDKVYVFQGFFEYKIVDLEGEYISSHLVHVENLLKLRAVGDSFYLLRGKVDQTFTKLELILSIYNSDFSSGEDLFTYDYPPGFRGPDYNFNWPNWVLVTDSGEFYFPEDNHAKFSIVAYSPEGEPQLVFGREYEIKAYSQEAKDRFYSMYEKQVEKGDMEFPQSPPIIRFMFQDTKKNIWVISGETYEDNRNPEYENSIDIFNRKGEWLYSFKSEKLSRYCLYNNGRIYRVLPINLDTFDQYIEVYEIKY